MPGEAGFLAAALIAVWVAAWLADTFAFRFDALIEAIVPTAGVFLFVSVLARPDYRLVSCALYLLAVFAFVAMHRAWLDERAPGWLADSSSSIAPTVLRTTLKVGAVAVVAALVLGPALPGAGEAPLWDLDTEQWRRHPRDAEPARRHPRPPRRPDRTRSRSRWRARLPRTGGSRRSTRSTARSGRRRRSTRACRVTCLARPRRSRPATPWSRRSRSRTCRRSGCPPRSRRST